MAGSICELRGCQRFARNVNVSLLLVGENTWVPQNPHRIASERIDSEQLGHFIVGALCCDLVSIICWPGETTRAKIRPKGPSSTPMKNHPHPLRPLLEAATAVTIPNRIQATANPIISPFKWCNVNSRSGVLSPIVQPTLTYHAGNRVNDSIRLQNTWSICHLRRVSMKL